MAIEMADLKDLTVPSGHTYHYAFRRPSSGLPTLLFLHGFPSSSYLWRHQVKHFAAKGYGLIVPDMLGNGSSSHPTDPKEYVCSLVAKDIIALLDAEDVSQAVVIGHDLGSALTSRLVNWYPDRCLAVAFLALGYQAPAIDWNIDAIDEVCRAALGREVLGYWRFLQEPDSRTLLVRREESFYSLVYANDTRIWGEWLGQNGKLRQWLEEDRRAPKPSWLSDGELQKHRRIMAQSGWEAPQCWYSTRYLGHTKEDEKDITSEQAQIQCPTLFIGAGYDPICIAAQAVADVTAHSHNLEVKVLEDVGHWIPEERPGETNEILESFIRGLPSVKV